MGTAGSVARPHSGSSRGGGWRRGPFGHDRNVYLILFFTLGKGLQLSIGAFVTGLYAHSLGFDKTFVGILVGVPAMGSLLASIPTGLLADRLGRKPLILIGSLLNPLALVALGLSTQAPALLVASFLNGVFSDAYWVTSLPILIESTSENRRVGVLAANNFLMLGVGALGSVLAGGLTELVAGMYGVPALSTVPLRFGLLAAALATFIPVVPLLWLRESHPTRHTRHTASGSAVVVEAQQAEATISPEAAAVVPSASAASIAPLVEASDPGVSAVVDPPTRAGLVALFTKLLIPDVLYVTGSGAALALLPVYFALNFHLDPARLGAFLSIEGVIGGATAFIAPRLVRRWGKPQTATTVQYLSVPVVLAIGFAPIFPLAAGAEVIRTALRGLFDPTYAAFTMEQVSARYRATLSSFYSVTWSVGFTIGSASAGWLYQHASYGAAVSLSALCIALAATLLRVWFARHPVIARGAAVAARDAREAAAAEA
jgi:MFS family permease